MVRRIYVEKKAPFAVKAKELKNEMSEYLGIEAEEVRVLIRYDVENVSDETFAKAKGTVFSEPPVDEVYEEEFPHADSDFCFTVEYLPGQFDQRAASCEECIQLVGQCERPTVRTARVYLLEGSPSDEELRQIKRLCDIIRCTAEQQPDFIRCISFCTHNNDWNIPDLQQQLFAG